MTKMYLKSTVFVKVFVAACRQKAFANFISIGLLLLTMVCSTETKAQILAWNFANPTASAGNEASIGPITIDANINNTPLVRGAGIASSLLSSGFGATNWENTTTTQALAQTANEYIQFTLTPKVGYTASLSSLSYRLRRSSTGPDKFIWRYSTDGTNFFDIGTFTSFTTALTGGTAFGPISISGIAALQSIPSTTTVTFRLYAWGASLTTGTFGVGKSATAAAADNSLVLAGTTAADGPKLAVTPTSRTGFTYVFGSGPSASQSFSLSGTNLTGFPGNITVSAPTDYETSLDNITFNSADKTVAYTTATLAATTVYIRLKAGLSVGNYDSELITCSGGGSADKTVNCDGYVSPSSSSDVIAVAASESATIPSTQNANAPLAIGTGAQVWSFTIRDGGGSSDADILPTIVNSITFAQAAGNSVSNWSQAIKTISLFDGATPVTATVSVTATQIQFTGMSLSVADNTNKTITVRLSLNCGIGGSNSDGDDFGFSLSNANFTTASVITSSQKASFAAITSANGSNVIDVAATKLTFTVQPTNVGVNASITPAVIVTATDACNNIDKNFASIVTITSTGTLTSTQAEAATNGIATFAAISFSAAGTGLTLTATAPGVTLIVSTTFDVTSTTALNPGDLMIVGFDTYSSGTPSGIDKLSVANLVPLLPGTEFSVANMDYEYNAAANVSTGRWYSGNGDLTQTPPYFTIKYNGSSNLAKGSVICITIASDGTVTDISVNGTTSALFSVPVTPPVGNSVQFSSADPDAFFLMQGTFSADQAEGTFKYKTFTGTVFGAIQTKGTFQDFSVAGNAGGSRVSRRYPTLKCIEISMPSAATAFYGYYKSAAAGGLHSGSQHDLISAIGNVATNWVTSATGTGVDDLATTSTCSNTFTVTTNVAYGYWVGTASSKDWYDCHNWDNFAIPDATVNVTIDASALNDCQIDANTSAYAAQLGNKGDAKSVTINGRKLIIENTGAIKNRLDLAGNMYIYAANGLDMSDGTATADGVINIKGNWTNTFANGFDPGQGEVNFNSTTSTQTITAGDGETFYNFTNSNSVAGGVVLANNFANVTVSNIFSLTNGLLTINGNTLTLNGTVAGAGTGTLSGSNNSILTIGGTAGGSLGTINFTAGSRLLNTLNMNRTGAGATAILGTDLAISNIANITSGILDAGTTTLNGAGGLTMTGGELQIGKTGTTVPELSGTYALTGGVVNFKGTASQTIRAVNYYDLTSTSTGARVLANSGTVGVASIFTPGTNTYTFTGSTVDYNGSAAQNIATFVSGASPGSTYNNLTLSNAGTKSLLANTDVEGTLGLNNTITFALGNNYLNIRSTATQTARVGPVSASANISYGTGNFVIERYFPGRRSWRLITAPVTVDATKSLYNSWQAGGAAPSGNGTYITGPGETAANGLDVSPQHNYSLKVFNQLTSQFDGVGNTKNTFISGITGTVGVPDNIGYFMFVRGDRTPANLDPFNVAVIGNATTLRDTGKIQTGTYVFNCNTNTGTHKYTVIGNPYASPADFNSLTKDNVANKFTVWDPTLNSVGGYAVWDGGVISPVGTAQTNSIIQSKQAFIVETTSSTTPSVTFTEPAKASTNNFLMFRPAPNPAASLIANLYTKNTNGTNHLADGVVAQYDNEYAMGEDYLDAVKFTNVNETFCIKNGNSFYILERRPFAKAGDTIFFSLKRTRMLNYRLEFTLSDIVKNKNLVAYLHDTYLKTSTALNMAGTTGFDFDINNNTGSAAADRFFITFKRIARFNNMDAALAASNVVVNWANDNETIVDRYEVERSVDGTNFVKVAEATANENKNTLNSYSAIDFNPAPGIYYYRIKAIGSEYGVYDYTEAVKIKVVKDKTGMYVYPNPVMNNSIGLKMNTAIPEGVYGVRLLTSGGQVMMNSKLQHTKAASTESINYPAYITNGTYQLEVTGPDKKKTVINIIIANK
jgi:hypothetical protein